MTEQSDKVKIIYFGGLMGDKQFAPDYPAPTHRGYPEALRELAGEYENVDFEHVAYQTAERPNPLVADIGDIAIAAIRQALDEYGNVVIVGNSVGAYPAIAGMKEALENLHNPMAMILIGPVYDPLTTVENLAGPAAIAALKAGQIAALPVDVSKADDQADPGKFYMGAAHFNDTRALRVVGKDDDWCHGTMASMVPNIRIFVARKDPLSPVDNAVAFIAQACGDVDPDQLKIWEDGGHNNRTDTRLTDVVDAVRQTFDASGQPKKLQPTRLAKPILHTPVFGDMDF